MSQPRPRHPGDNPVDTALRQLDRAVKAYMASVDYAIDMATREAEPATDWPIAQTAVDATRLAVTQAIADLRAAWSHDPRTSLPAQREPGAEDQP